MEYDDVIADFAERTLRNLDFVQHQVRDGDDGLYDVTQLWNSLVGLIVLPLETRKKRGENGVPATLMAALEGQGWPRLTVDGGEDESLHDLVWHLRHAVAHANVRFHPDGKRRITSVEMWNESRSGKRYWTGRATVDELDRFVRLVAATYQEAFGTAAA